MKISPEQAVRVDRILDELLDLPPSEREAHLDSACQQDAPLKAHIQRLLRFSEVSDEQFAEQCGLNALSIEGSPSDLGPGQKGTDQPRPEVGQTVGPYRIIEEIGRGGMGVVYLAERVDGGFEQKVALKLSLRVAHSLAQARFQQERQILAELRHPNIAHLLDGGITEDGLTYFALELIEGQPIDDYCDSHRLDLDERLALFEQVAEGVRAAHSNLVVHRDIKPNNILVTDEGQVKLIDFGIAKLLEEGPSDVELTVPALRVMTPQYASPEQVTGRQISPASDIYQLGLLLYQLLSGDPPYRLENTTPAMVEKTVCKDDPPQPSHAIRRLCRSKEDRPRAQKAAKRRRTTPERLAKDLRGDLDTIVLKALQKEPSRRYISASDLLEDVRRYRAGLPIRAVPDTLAYRSKKFVRRNRWPVAAAATFLLFLLGYGVTLTVQAKTIREQRDRATAEAKRAEATKDFLLDLFERSSPVVARTTTLTARDLLDQGVGRLETELADEPLLSAELSITLANAYNWLGEFDQSFALTQRSQALLVGLPADSTAELRYRAKQTRASTFLELQEPGEAGPLIEEALALAWQVHGEDHLSVAVLLRMMGTLKNQTADFAGAIDYYELSLAMINRITEEPIRERADALLGIGVIHQTQGRQKEALGFYREADQEYLLAEGEDYPERLETQKNLGMALGSLGHREEGLAVNRSAVLLAKKIFGTPHPEVANQMNGLGLQLVAMGKIDEGIEVLTESLEQRQSLYTVGTAKTILSQLNLGYGYFENGALDPAEALFRQAIEEGKPGSGAVILSEWYLGKTLLARRDFSNAARWIRSAWEEQVVKFGVDDGQVAEMATELAMALRGAGRQGEARAFLEDQLAQLAPDSQVRGTLTEALETGSS